MQCEIAWYLYHSFINLLIIVVRDAEVCLRQDMPVQPVQPAKHMSVIFICFESEL